MIKKEDGCIILIFKKIVKGVAYIYKINITSKKVKAISKEGIDITLNWNNERSRMREMLEEAIIEMDEIIMNNKNIMYTAILQKNTFEAEKAEKHLEKKKDILTILKSYKF
jgi:hypothetical protein